MKNQKKKVNTKLVSRYVYIVIVFTCLHIPVVAHIQKGQAKFRKGRIQKIQLDFAVYVTPKL